jgi:hypothetical protein
MRNRKEITEVTKSGKRGGEKEEDTKRTKPISNQAQK